MPVHIANISINDGRVSRDGNLTVTVNETYYSIGGNNGFFAGASEQSVVNNDSSYAYLDSYGDLYIEISGWPADPHGRLAKIVSAGGYITDIIDMRAYITESGGMRAHDLGGSWHNSDTLDNLNAKIIDAVLIDRTELDGYAAVTHASQHQNGGADEISVAGLSGELADPQTPKSHNLGGSEHSSDTLANLNSKISDATLDDSSDSRTPTSHASSHENGGGDEISVAGLNGELVDDQPPKAHALGGSKHSADTLANLNTKISDATLDDSSDPRTPTSHASSHQNGGADEIATATPAVNAIPKAGVGGDLNGGWMPYGSSSNTVCEGDDSRLSDARTPTSHSSSHENGGGDEISVAGLSGELADDQPPKSHASDHEPSGSDAMTVDAVAGTGSLRTLGTGAQTACAGNDSRLSDARTPTSHASSHQNGGSDEVATATPAVNAIPKTAGSSTLAAGWIPDGGDSTAIHDNIASEISAITEKVTPVSADLIIIEDSAAANAKKRVQVGNLPGGSGDDPDAIHDNESGEINAISEKSSPVGADVLVIEDSAASYAKKKVQITNLPGGADPDAIHDNVSGEISAITEKTNPVDDDLFIIEDSAASNAKKRVKAGVIGDGFHNDATQIGTFNTSSTSYVTAYGLNKYCPAGGRMLGEYSFLISADKGDPYYICAFDCFDTTGGTEVASGAAVPLNAERQKTSEFTHSTVTNNSEVTVGADGLYRVTYDVTTRIASGNARSASAAWLELDTGGGFSEIDGTRGRMYNKEADEGGTTCSATAILDLDNGDKLRVWATRTSGASEIQLYPDGSRLVIERLDRTKVGLAYFRCTIDGNVVVEGAQPILYANIYQPVHVHGLWTIASAGNKDFQIQVKIESAQCDTVYVKQSRIRAYLAK